jgi:hypothetical protein
VVLRNRRFKTMKHTEGPLECGCFLAEAGPPLSLGGGITIRDWRIIKPCAPHQSTSPVIFSFCMTCKKVYGSKPSGKDENGALSHGYCGPCGEEALKAFKGA